MDWITFVAWFFIIINAVVYAMAITLYFLGQKTDLNLQEELCKIFIFLPVFGRVLEWW